MIEMRSEFQEIASRALHGDTGLVSMLVAGTTAADLTWSISPGDLPTKIGGHTYSPSVPFKREQLVELIGNTLKKRWSRYDDFLLEIKKPHHSEQELLHRKWQHRRLFPSVGPGWFDLIDAAMELAQAADPEPWTISDCKEKFGTLRLYASGIGRAGDAYIDAAEYLSGSICDICGAPGKLRAGGWITTRCDEHKGARS